MSGELLETLGRTSVQFGALVLVVCAVERLLGERLTPRWRYGLWLLVFARLALPVVPTVSLGAPWPADVAPSTVPSELSCEVPSARAPRAGDARDVAARTPGGAAWMLPASGVSAEPPPPARRAPGVADVAIAFWLLGVALLLGRAGAGALRLARRVRSARTTDEPRMTALLADARRRMRFDGALRVLEVDDLHGPAVTGLFRPALLLPPGFGDALSDDEVAHVLRHELAHLRHRDVAWLCALRALACTYWFHPLAWVGLRRLRASQESVRDWESLAAAPSPAPLEYARTLLKLAEGRPPAVTAMAVTRLDVLGGLREMRRRMTMIRAFGTPSRSTPLFGAGLLLAVSWVGFTRGPAAEEPPSTEPAPVANRDAGQRRRIPVERPAADPTWRADRAAHVAKSRVSLEYGPGPLSEALAAVEEAAGLRIDGWPLVDDYGDPEVRVRARGLTIPEVLDQVLLQSDGITWSMTESGVRLHEGEIVDAELRFYQLAPLLEGAEDDLDQLLYLMIEGSDPDRPGLFDLDGTSIESMGTVVAVSHSPEVHEEVEALLEFLLNRGWPEPDDPEWRRAITAALPGPLDVRLEEGTPLGEVAGTLTGASGVLILIDAALGEVVDEIEGETTLERVLVALADQLDANVRVEAGAVFLTHRAPRIRLELIELESLLEAAADRDPDDVVVELEHLTRSQVAPELWDTWPAMSLQPWRGAFLIAAPERVHAETRALLAALERAHRHE